MKILIILLIWSVVPFIHKYLLKWLPYRWLIQSIIYPYHRYRLKRRLLLMNENEVINMWFEWRNVWFTRYWFGRSLMKIVEDRRMELLERR